MDAPFSEQLKRDLVDFMKNDNSSRGENLYESVFRSSMFPLQRKNELREMMALARTMNPRVVMEIGTDKGGGAFHWICGLKLHAFVGIEVRGVPVGDEFIKRFPSTQQLWIPASSYDPTTVKLVKEWLDKYNYKIDVLFIDGDKSRFTLDFNLYLPMVCEGGIVFMHDCRDAAPGAAFQECRSNRRVRASCTIESTIESAYATMRELAGVPPADSYEGWLRHWKGRSCGVGVMWV